MNLSDYIFVCPRCNGEEVERDGCCGDCVCSGCGYRASSLFFTYWPDKYRGENSYLICN